MLIINKINIISERTFYFINYYLNAIISILENNKRIFKSISIILLIKDFI